MEKIKLIIDLIDKTIWPVVIFTIFLMFRKHIIKILPNIKKLKAGGLELTIDKIEGIIDETLENKFIGIDTSENFKKIVYQTEEKISDNFDTKMLAFTANQSFNENLKYNIYYDPVKRNHNFSFKYIGLYKAGKISAVGKLTKIVHCDYKNGELVSTNENNINLLAKDEIFRIKSIIENTGYYDLKEGCKFFLVDKFYETNFIKSSNYPIRAKKYIWLNDIVGFNEGMDAEELAKLLNGREWE